MIPASYLFKDLYTDRWGDPDNPHAVDVPPADDAPRGPRTTALFARLAGLFQRRPERPTAWSFTIPARVHHNRTR